MDTSTSDSLSEDLGIEGTGKCGLRIVLVELWTFTFFGDLNSDTGVGVFTGDLITFTAPLGTIILPGYGNREHTVNIH